MGFSLKKIGKSIAKATKRATTALVTGGLSEVDKNSLKRGATAAATGGMSEAARAAGKALAPPPVNIDFPEETVMPEADEEAIRRARRRMLERRGGGRAGTILSDVSEGAL